MFLSNAAAVAAEAFVQQQGRSAVPVPVGSLALPPAAHRPLVRWIVRFLFHLEVIEGKSENTVRHYAHDLGLFSRYLRVHAPWIARPADVTGPTISGFLRYMQVIRGNSAMSNRRRLASIRRFFRYLYESGAIPSDPTAPLPKIQPERRPAPVLTRDEALRILEAAKTTHFPTRDHAIFRLFLTCGCTLSELVALQLSDFDPKESAITFHGRKGRIRTVPLTPTCRRALQDYLNDRPKSPASTHLFLNRLGQGVTRGAIYHAFDIILKRSGIDKPGVTIHSLRRTCLTLLWEAGVSLHTLQHIAGHSSLASTKEYAPVQARPAHPPPWKSRHPLEE